MTAVAPDQNHDYRLSHWSASVGMTSLVSLAVGGKLLITYKDCRAWDEDCVRGNSLGIIAVGVGVAAAVILTAKQAYDLYSAHRARDHQYQQLTTTASSSEGDSSSEVLVDVPD